MSEPDLDRLSIPEIQRAMREGRLTAAGLTDRYLARIAEHDGAVNAVAAVSPLARQEAAAADRRRRDGRCIGPLDGIPVLVKDSIDTAGLASTAGSRALLGRPATRDAWLVSRLRSVGAVVLGKTTLSEWENFRSWRCTSGWSGTAGQTNNPHALDRNPCGSSAGSAAAAAASFAQVTIGSESDGSLICPAGVNGVVGHKPTLGLIPRTGMLAIAREQHTAGPIARHVVDVALALRELQGVDPLDPVTRARPYGGGADLSDLADLAALDAGVLRGRRIGVWRLAGCVAEVDRVVETAVRVLRDRGAELVDVELPLQHEIGKHKIPAMAAELRRDVERYLGARAGHPRTLAELVEFNRRDAVELVPFGQEILEFGLTAPSTEGPEHRRHRTAATELARRSVDTTMAEHAVDILLAPTNSPAWRTDYATGDALPVSSSAPAAVAGYPSVTVPAGFAGGLPVGVSFVGRRWADADVLSVALAFERASAARRAPEFRPSVG